MLKACFDGGGGHSPREKHRQGGICIPMRERPLSDKALHKGNVMDKDEFEKVYPPRDGNRGGLGAIRFGPLLPPDKGREVKFSLPKDITGKACLSDKEFKLIDNSYVEACRGLYG